MHTGVSAEVSTHTPRTRIPKCMHALMHKHDACMHKRDASMYALTVRFKQIMSVDVAKSMCMHIMRRGRARAHLYEGVYKLGMYRRIEAQSIGSRLSGSFMMITSWEDIILQECKACVCCIRVFLYHLVVQAQSIAPPRNVLLHCQPSCSICRRRRVLGLMFGA